MRYLFVHQNFPAQYVYLLRHLAARRQDELLYLTEASRGSLTGVRKVVRKAPRKLTAGMHVNAQDFESASLRADLVMQSSRQLKKLGFEPDIIIGHHGWGELMHIQDVWPDAPVLGYYEFYYHTDGFDIGFDPEFKIGLEQFPRVRSKNTINLVALNNPGFGQTPTEFQLSTYPPWARSRMRLLPEGVNLDICKPNPALRKKTISIGGYKVAPHEKLVTYVARDLEPYRGFHIMMRALPRILAQRPDARVMVVGGDGISYGAACPSGTWRSHMLSEVGDRLDLSRVHFLGRVSYDDYVKMIQRSDAHVYLTYPFVTSWSLRESLAAGCAIVGSDTAPVREFVQHRKTGLLAPFLQPDKVADAVCELLEDTALAARLRRNARIWAEKHLDMNVYLRAYEELIDDVINRRV